MQRGARFNLAAVKAEMPRKREAAAKGRAFLLRDSQARSAVGGISPMPEARLRSGRQVYTSIQHRRSRPPFASIAPAQRALRRHRIIYLFSDS
jgi:hypothetical protein